MVGGFLSSGLSLGQVAGIEIRVSWLLLIYWLFDLSHRSHDESFIFPWLLGVVLMFGSILLHELGHCFAARRVGGDAREILLWPLGGLAYCESPPRWKARLAVAAGGPLVTVLILGASYAGFAIGRGPLEEETSLAFWTARRTLVHWNFVILIFNLIPLYPMDGGRIFHSFAWGFFGRGMSHPLNGYAKASRITYAVSLVTGIAGIALAVYWKDTALAILLFLMLLEAGTLKDGA
jgi:Zn-dependent protease